jgi:predicted dehydrogenase
MGIQETKVAVVGCGAVAREAHFPAWRKIKGIALTAVCDNTASLAKSAAFNYKIPHYYDDFAEMLNIERPALVDICTPPVTHVSMISAALTAGCDIIVEKPLALTLQETRIISDLYAKRANPNSKLSVLYNWLFHPQIMTLIRHVEKGDIGTVLNVEIQCLHPPDEPMIANPQHWCHTLPAGRFGEVLIHPLYLLNRLLGNLHAGETRVAKRGNLDWVQYDELSVNFKGDRGFGSLYVSFNSPALEFPILTVLGTRGRITFNGHNLNLILLKPTNGDSLLNRGLDSLDQIGKIGGSLTLNALNKILGSYKSSHQMFFQAFFDCQKSQVDFPLSFEDSLEANQVYLDIIDRIMVESR